MGDAVVLRSHDCLPGPYGSRSNAAKSFPNSATASRSRHRKRNPTGLESGGQDRCRSANSDPKSPVSESPPPKGGNLVMGKVKILKRGEALPDLISDDRKPAPVASPTIAAGCGHDELIILSTDRLGPDPETVQIIVRASDFYASSPLVASPPPSSLPLPAFFCKEKKKIDAATDDLLRLLRLDFS